LIPHSPEAEVGALGSVLIANGNAANLLDKLNEDHFYDVRHKTIFRALLSLQFDNASIDTISLDRFLRDQNLLEAAGGNYVNEIPDRTPSAEQFPVWLQTLEDRAERRRQINEARQIQARAVNLSIPAKPRERLTFRRPSEFVGMAFDDSDIILGDRLLAKGQSLVIAGAGGTGKSRFVLQLAAAVTTGRKFLSFDTSAQKLRWLILQTENSNRRLSADMDRLKGWLGKDWAAFDSQILIHAIESDLDSFVSLDSEDNVANIAHAIQEHQPDVVAIDPLNDFGVGDLNKDADMKATVQILTRICRKGNPDRAIVVLHHALTGKGGAAKVTGYDRASFARNSKALHAWARGQINLAAIDEDNNERLIIACGKCSNGREFPAFAVQLNTSNLVYDVDPTVDVKAWESDLAGKPNGPLISNQDVAKLCRGPMTKAELAKAVRDDCGCPRTAAYRYIKRSVSARLLKFNDKTECYSATK
jgi:hypothetical protein